MAQKLLKGNQHWEESSLNKQIKSLRALEQYGWNKRKDLACRNTTLGESLHVITWWPTTPDTRFHLRQRTKMLSETSTHTFVSLNFALITWSLCGTLTTKHCFTRATQQHELGVRGQSRCFLTYNSPSVPFLITEDFKNSRVLRRIALDYNRSHNKHFLHFQSGNKLFLW